MRLFPGERIEFEGFNQKPLTYDVVLDEIAETGYAGTDWGLGVHADRPRRAAR